MLFYLVQHMVLHCLLCVARCRHDWGLRTDQSTWLVKFSIPNHNTWYYIALTLWSRSTICPHTLHPASLYAVGHLSCTWWLLQTMSHALIGLGPRPASQLGVHAAYSFHSYSQPEGVPPTYSCCVHMCLEGARAGIQIVVQGASSLPMQCV